VGFPSLKFLPNTYRGWARKYKRKTGICEFCGEASKYIHHQDKNVMNNLQGNLIEVCASCHRKEHNFNSTFYKKGSKGGAYLLEKQKHRQETIKAHGLEGTPEYLMSALVN